MAISAPPPTSYNPFQRNAQRLLNLHTWRGQFAALMVLIVVLALVCTYAAYYAFNDTQNRFKTAAQDSAPSIVAAQDMDQAAQNLEANVTDFLLTADSTFPVTMGTHRQDVLNITNNRALFRDGLYRATLNMTEPDEKVAVPEISRLYEQYSARIDTILYAYQTVSRDAAYKIYFDPANSPNAVLGDDGSPTTLLGQLAKLETINRNVLNTANANAQNSITLARIVVALLSLALLATLGFSTYLLIERTHRIINPLLVPALLVALYFVFSIFVTLGKAGDDYNDAANHAFPNVDTAVRLKALATNARADESRWIIANQSQASTDPTVQSTAIQRSTNAQNLFTSEQADLATQLAKATSNISYRGEAENIGVMYQALSCYRYLDGQIRAFYLGSSQTLAGDLPTPTQFPATNIGVAAQDQITALLGVSARGNCPVPVEQVSLGGKADPQAAIRLDVGQSNDAFARFVSAADNLKNINSGHFSDSVNGALDYLSRYALLSLIIFPLIALFGAAGVLLRQRDF